MSTALECQGPGGTNRPQCPCSAPGAPQPCLQPSIPCQPPGLSACAPATPQQGRAPASPAGPQPGLALACIRPQGGAQCPGLGLSQCPLAAHSLLGRWNRPWLVRPCPDGPPESPLPLPVPLFQGAVVPHGTLT